MQKWFRCAGADDVNLDNILGKASSLSHISAVIMVANGSQSRQTITMKNVFTLLRGHLPDAVLKNTLVVLTNCTKMTRCVSLRASTLHSHIYLYADNLQACNNLSMMHSCLLKETPQVACGSLAL